MAFAAARRLPSILLLVAAVLTLCSGGRISTRVAQKLKKAFEFADYEVQYSFIDEQKKEKPKRFLNFGKKMKKDKQMKEEKKHWVRCLGTTDCKTNPTLLLSAKPSLFRRRLTVRCEVVPTPKNRCGGAEFADIEADETLRVHVDGAEIGGNDDTMAIKVEKVLRTPVLRQPREFRATIRPDVLGWIDEKQKAQPTDTASIRSDVSADSGVSISSHFSTDSDVSTGSGVSTDSGVSTGSGASIGSYANRPVQVAWEKTLANLESSDDESDDGNNNVQINNGKAFKPIATVQQTFFEE